MKNLIIFLCTSLMMIFIFTSCSKETNSVKNEVIQANNELVIQELTSDADFIASLEVVENIKQDIQNFFAENVENIQQDPTILNNFINDYSKDHTMLSVHKANIIKKFPQITSISGESLMQMVENSSETAKKGGLSINFNCSACFTNCACCACYNCLNAADYHAYLVNPNLDYDWFLNAFESNLQELNSCRANCPNEPVPCPSGNPDPDPDPFQIDNM